MLIGYVRVSTDDQNLDLQCDALRQAGCEKIYEDRISGAKAARPGLTLALEVRGDASNGEGFAFNGSMVFCPLAWKGRTLDVDPELIGAVFGA